MDIQREELNKVETSSELDVSSLEEQKETEASSIKLNKQNQLSPKDTSDIHVVSGILESNTKNQASTDISMNQNIEGDGNKEIQKGEETKENVHELEDGEIEEESTQHELEDGEIEEEDEEQEDDEQGDDEEYFDELDCEEEEEEEPKMIWVPKK